MLYVVMVILTFIFAGQSMFGRLYSSAYAGKGDGSSVFSVLYGIVVGVITLAISGFAFAPSWQTLLLGAVNAVTLYMYNMSLLNGSVRGSYGFLMICSVAGGMLVPIFYDAISHGQMLAGTEIAALALLLASSVCMNLKGLSRSSDWKYYAWCAVLFCSNGLYGTFMNVQQELMGGMQRSEMIIITYMGMGLGALAAIALKHRKAIGEAFDMGKSAWMYAIFACIAATVASNIMMYLIANFKNITFLYAFNNGSVLVVSAVLAAILLKEKLLPPRIAGIALASAGIVLLCL